MYTHYMHFIITLSSSSFSITDLNGILSRARRLHLVGQHAVILLRAVDESRAACFKPFKPQKASKSLKKPCHAMSIPNSALEMPSTPQSFAAKTIF